MTSEAVTPMHHLMIMVSSAASGRAMAEARLAVIATLSKGYDLDYIWRQVDRDLDEGCGRVLHPGQRERRGAAGPLVGAGRAGPRPRAGPGGRAGAV